MTAKYPTAIAGPGDLPPKSDGAVIYGSHMNAVQDEIMAIETLLGLGSSATAGVPSLVDGGFATLVARLTSMSTSIADGAAHRGASSGVHGVVGNVVGTTDTQTLTNKTIVSPTITGTVTGAITWGGNVTFSNNVTIVGSLTMTGTPSITDFTNAQHDHSTPAKGGNIPQASVTGLTAALAGKAPTSHTHTKSQITDFQHDISSHTGNLDVARIVGLGTAAALNVPAVSNTAATAGEVVRGDDPRLGNSRTPAAHAATHATSGSDPISPASIGAAEKVHSHLKAEITDFQHDLNSHSGNLDLSRVTGLSAALAGKLNANAQAVDSAKVGGRRITVSTTAPASPSVNDVWIDI